MRGGHICRRDIKYQESVSNTGGTGMKKIIDARGLSCPEPALKLKREIDGADEIELLADNQACVENCGRLARSRGFRVSVSGGSGQYTMTLTKE